MKRRQKRTLSILALGILGLAALLLRPALLPDSLTLAGDATAHAPSPGDAATPEMVFDWNLTEKRPHFLVFRDAPQQDAFSLLRSGIIRLHVRPEDEKLRVDATPGQSAIRAADALSRTRTKLTVRQQRLRQNADGTAHHQLTLICELTVEPPFLAKPIRSTAVESLRVCTRNGKAGFLTTPPPPAAPRT